MQRPVVVLPLPDSPTRPNVSPSSIEKLTSSTARTTVRLRRNSPLPRANSFTRLRTSRSAIRGQVRLTAGPAAAAVDRRRSALAAATDRALTAAVQVALHRRGRRRDRLTPGCAVGHGLEAIGTARREGAARRQLAERAARCPESPAAARPARRPASTPSARACTDASDRRTARATGASSTMRPAYITATRSAISATTPRSWVMSSSARPHPLLQLAQQIEDLRLDRDVERRRRLVGDEQRRLAGERHRDQRALPQAARQLMRIVADAPLRLGHAAPRRAARSPSRAPSRRVARPCTRSVSSI